MSTPSPALHGRPTPTAAAPSARWRRRSCCCSPPARAWASRRSTTRSQCSARRATIAQAWLSMGFSAFWSTLAVMLHAERFHLGSTAAGAFGLAGAAGALAAPLAGRLADRRGPEVVTRLGAAVAMLSFVGMAVGVFLPPNVQLVLLVLGAIGFDLGVQASLIAHQTIVYGIDPGARSRLNAVLLVGMFIAMAVGSALGAYLLAEHGWLAVVAMSAAVSLAALLTRLWPAAAVSGR